MKYIIVLDIIETFLLYTYCRNTYQQGSKLLQIQTYKNMEFTEYTEALTPKSYGMILHLSNLQTADNGKVKPEYGIAIKYLIMEWHCSMGNFLVLI